MLDQPNWDPHAVTQLTDIVGNQETWKKLADSIRTNSCPHIVLCGPAGCGKSLFTKILLEYEMRVPIVRVECTANSGLRDLRDMIRGFARGSRTGKGDFRWIVLEHADSLAGDTQAFLRRMMETTSASTRFLFECADAGAISEPILSRSMLVTVNSPNEKEIAYELQRRTGFSLKPEEVEAICRLSCENMRSAVYYALAQKWNGDVLGIANVWKQYSDILAKAPAPASASNKPALEKDWVAWGIYAEKECRLRGLDCKDILFFGWPTNPDVNYMRTQWSRLGGISSRALFFRTLHKLSQTR
jgi:replication-associated recombination protein RarA